MALISCPECGKQVSDKAAACPNCGANPQSATRPTKQPPKLASQVKNFVGLVILVFALAFVYRVVVAFRNPRGASTSATASDNEASDNALQEIYADRISALYADNEVNADNLLRGKRMKIIGKVTSITRDIMDNPQLSFDGGGYSGAVAQLNSSAHVDGLHPGDYVRVRCTVAGMTLGMPYLRDCD